MAFWNKQKKESLTDGRKFKQADLSDFIPPVFVAEREIRASDEELIERLKQNFTEAGVVGVEESTEEIDSQSIDELVEILHEANEGALNEKDFHTTKQFDEKLHQDLDHYEHDFKGGDNFLLDGMDDYGNQIYETGSTPIWE